jgi:hypothetical protein
MSNEVEEENKLFELEIHVIKLDYLIWKSADVGYTDYDFCLSIETIEKNFLQRNVVIYILTRIHLRPAIILW